MYLDLISRHWEQVRIDLYSTIDLFTDEELTFKPFKGSWPVGQIMLHIADCEDNWLHGVVRHEFEPWIFYSLADFPTKRDVKVLLMNAHQRTLTFFETLDQADLLKIYSTSEGGAYPLEWIIWHVLEHEIHHRGELSLALGLLGHQGLDV